MDIVRICRAWVSIKRVCWRVVVLQREREISNKIEVKSYFINLSSPCEETLKYSPNLISILKNFDGFIKPLVDFYKIFRDFVCKCVKTSHKRN